MLVKKNLFAGKETLIPDFKLSMESFAAISQGWTWNQQMRKPQVILAAGTLSPHAGQDGISLKLLKKVV